MNRTLAAAFLLLFIVTGMQFTPPLFAYYQVGETARVDIATPLSLMVVDREKTEALRQREAQKIPAIFRFHLNAAAEAEANLRGSCNFTREDFLESLEESFKQRRLSASACAKPRFVQFVNSYKRKNKLFPLSTNLAEAWATGGTDEPFVAEWAAKLRQAMESHIRTDPMPSEAKVGPMMVRIIQVPMTNAPVELEAVAKESTPFARTNILTLSKVRKELENSYPPEEQGMGKFLSMFVRPNCFFDPVLTKLSRAKPGETLWAADSYESGQMIVKSGQVVTAGIKLALDQLKSKNALAQFGLHAAEEQRSAHQSNEAQLRQQALAAESRARDAGERNRWLLAGLLAGIVISSMTVWRIAKWKAGGKFLPARIARPPAPAPGQGAQAVISCPSCDGTILVELPAKVRSFTSVPEVNQPSELDQGAPWMKRMLGKAVRALLWERVLMLDTQRLAEMELTALEKRLAKMNAPVQERIHAYEIRIAELEKQLTAQQQQNSEMIRAQIVLAKQKLQSVRQNAPVA